MSMHRLFITPLVELIVISPLIAMTVNRNDHKWKFNIFLFVSYFFVYNCLLFSPTLIPALRLIEGDWNWSGKLYGVTGSILFIMLFRKAFGEYNYISFKQRETSLKPKLMVTIVVFLLAVGLATLSIYKSIDRFEYYFFQFTMPGLDEELAFRGIMLGLLSNALTSKVYCRSISLGNPALLITSILFGLGHSLQIDHDWCFHQNWVEFISTFATGLLLGWLTIKSGSILMSILIHDLLNTLPLLMAWNK